jgi:NCAIR mutase (PurE)-related protein
VNFVNHENDEQQELLNHLLELSDGLNGSSHKRPELTSQQAEELRLSEDPRQRQKTPAATQTEISPAIQTRPDTTREQRKGAPEVIYGETKSTAQIIEMARGLLAGTGRAIISRVPPQVVVPLQEAFREYRVSAREASRSVVIYAPDYIPIKTGGHVGVISAGTSDIPIAEEAGIISEEMGCEVTYIYDVGVAGLHRLVSPLRDLIAREVDVIIVAAGMDGALPSVVAGLVPVPVIGLPTSIGYGLGGRGVAALLSMLQTCAPGLSVVNIDNGVGAGITAALIANRVAQAREHQSR